MNPEKPQRLNYDQSAEEKDEKEGYDFETTSACEKIYKVARRSRG